MTFTIERQVHLGSVPASRRGGHRTIIRPGPAPATAPPALPPSAPSIPRIAKLMALAIRCDHLIRSGAVNDASDLAAIAHVTQPRMTQILNLTLLAPDIQEDLLYLAGDQRGRIGEHHLRPITALVRWDRQREAWRRLVAEKGG